MRSPGLVVGVIGATLIVGYAFYMLTPSSSSPRPERVATERSEAKARPKARRPAARPATRQGRRPVPAPGLRSDEPRPTPSVPAAGETPSPAPVAGQPPRPEPAVSLEEAREKFAEYMAVLERLEDEGVTLESEQWVDYYKSGHDALLPLQQHLDWQVPDEAAELRKANEDMRNTLQKLQPVPTPP